MAVRLAPNTVFAGDFRVVQPLSQGGMGAVYVVEQASTGARRALKVMLPHLVADDDARARFEREAKVGARIASDHVVQVIAAGVDEATGAPWLVMELLEGESLDERVRRAGPLSYAEARTLFAQLGHAVGAAHEAGIVHRDLKPENLHLGRGRRAEEPLTLKVLDFGIAKLTLGTAGAATAPIGTLGWMAPEQAEADAEITPRTDVWSIGLLAFFALTGRSFWRTASSGSAPSILRELMFDTLPLASERAKELGGEGRLPIGFDAWFAGAVSRDVGARFDDGGEACRALVRLLEGASAPIEKTVFAQASGPRPVEARAVPPQRVDRRWALVGGGVACVLAGTLLVWKVGPANPGAPAASAAASAGAPQPAPTAITALPPPKCESPKVHALYASALQDFRDANWGHARARLKEAAEIEPSCAAVQLRLAMTEDAGEKIASYQRALEHRSDLEPRDRALLEVVGLESEGGRSEPAAKRALEAARGFPGDAELWGLACAEARHDVDASISYCRKALELDPQYADAWQGLATAFRAAGKVDERREALDRCIAISASSVDCRRDRSEVAWAAGQCDGALADLRDAIALDPKALDLRQSLSGYLAMRDRPYEARLQALQDGWALVGETRPFVEAGERLELEMSFGHNAEAERQRKRLEDLMSREDTPHRTLRDLAYRDVATLLRFERFADAARVADAFLKRSEAWSDAREGGPMLLDYALFRAGKIGRDAYEERRRKLTEALKGMTSDPWQLWLVSYPIVFDREEAERAVAARPQSAPPKFSVRALGMMQAFAGHGKEALALVAEGEPCDGGLPSFARALALEEVGELAEACGGYAKIIERYGKEEPVGREARMSRDALRRLHCKAPSP